MKNRVTVEAAEMKIWFDISNSPHVNMFKEMINDLRIEHEIVVTCRDLANTISLLNLHNIPHEKVGRHYGKSLVKKIVGYPIRLNQLGRHISKKNIDVAISQSSFHSPLVSRAHGVPSIYLNDNEHALGNVPAFAFASIIMVPEHMSDDKLRSQFASKKKLIKYPGVKEGIYLWREAARIQKLRSGKHRQMRPVVCYRPEPTTAQYYSGNHSSFDPLLKGLAKYAEIRVYPRDREQTNHYIAIGEDNIQVITAAADLTQISSQCDIFIGAGGTMTREMAVLGIPTISVYQEKLLDVDRYLIEQGAIVHKPRLEPDEVMDLFGNKGERSINLPLLEKGREAYNMIITELMRYNK
jgi:predicted glycosyltransferase